MTHKKKIIGLSCGRIMGNSEILLKAALMAAEPFGIETEIIRAMEMRIKPCVGCETCSLSYSKGIASRCAINDDDVPWILEKILLEDCALIVSVPIYSMMANAHLVMLTNRTLPVLFNHPEIKERSRPGGIICVGGSGPERTPLGLVMANIFMLRTRKVVDQVQVNYAPRPGSVLVNEYSLDRVKKLGENLAKALMMTAGQIDYAGEKQKDACPVCHCNLFQVRGELPEVVCPICNVRGILTTDGHDMRVVWNEEDVRNPIYSLRSDDQHRNNIRSLINRFYEKDLETVQKLIIKYADYGRIISP